MSEILSHAVSGIGQLFTQSLGASPVPLLVVAGYAGSSLVLYGLTRGKEFLIAGYSSVMFLVPFIRLH